MSFVVTTNSVLHLNKNQRFVKDLDNEEKVVKEISSFLRRKLQTNLQLQINFISKITWLMLVKGKRPRGGQRISDDVKF